MAATLETGNVKRKLTGGWRKLMTPDTKIRANHRILMLRANAEAKKSSIQSEAKPDKLLEQAMMVKE